MVTYYLDVVTNPAKPQLIRQVKYPNFPVAAPANPPQAVGEVVENFPLQLRHRQLDGCSRHVRACWFRQRAHVHRSRTPFLFRAVNVYLGGRSEYPWTWTNPPQFFRNSLSTQVSIRSLSFGVLFPTPGILP